MRSLWTAAYCLAMLPPVVGFASLVESFPNRAPYKIKDPNNSSAGAIIAAADPIPRWVLSLLLSQAMWYGHSRAPRTHYQ